MQVKLVLLIKNLYSHLNFRKDAFPFGIQKIKIYHRSRFLLTVIPPGGFYTIARKSNELEIERDNSYGYSITYGIFKKFNKNNITCKESLNFLEDECKLNQVKVKHYNIPQFSITFSKRYQKSFWKHTIVSLLGWTFSICKYYCIMRR